MDKYEPRPGEIMLIDDGEESGDGSGRRKWYPGLVIGMVRGEGWGKTCALLSPAWWASHGHPGKRLVRWALGGNDYRPFPPGRPHPVIGGPDGP